MEYRFVLFAFIMTALFVSCDEQSEKKIAEFNDEMALSEVIDSSFSLQTRFNDLLNDVYKNLFEGLSHGEDLIVIPVANEDSIQSVALVKGIYKPIPEYEFNGYMNFGESRVIFLNLKESIYDIIDRATLKDSPYIYTMDELGLGSYSPTYRYVTIYSSDSLTLSEFPIIGGK